MTLMLRQCLQLECPLCKQAITDEQQRETAQILILFGAEGYAVCPNCLQQVSTTTFKDRRYRRRVDRWIERKKRELASTTAQ